MLHTASLSGEKHGFTQKQSRWMKRSFKAHYGYYISHIINHHWRMNWLLDNCAVIILKECHRTTNSSLVLPRCFILWCISIIVVFNNSIRSERILMQLKCKTKRESNLTKQNAGWLCWIPAVKRERRPAPAVTRCRPEHAVHLLTHV